MTKALDTLVSPDRPLGEPVFETIDVAPQHSFYWHKHDYPAPLARWNYHPEYELHLITHTTGKFFVGDHIGLFEPGQLVLVGPNLPHAWFSELSDGRVARGRDVVLQFKGELIEQLVTTCPEFKRVHGWLSRAKQGLEFHGETAFDGARLLERMEYQDALGRLLTFFELLGNLAASRESRTLASVYYSPTLQSDSSGVISQVLHYLTREYCNDIRMAHVAGEVGMSESTFSRFFRRTTGETFVTFLHRLRIRQACKLLLDERLSISEICFRVGYNNLSNFNRHFLEEMQLTPTSYRKKMLQRSVRSAMH